MFVRLRHVHSRVGWLVISAVALCALALAGPGTAADAPIVMRVSHEKDPKYWGGIMIDEWARAIEADTKGAVRVEVHPNSEAFQPEDIFGAVKSGKIEAGMSESHDYSGFVPSAAVLMRPYTFADRRAIERFLDSPLRQHLDKNADAAGVHPVMWMAQAFDTAYGSADHPYVVPADFKGAPIRSLNVALNPSLMAMGAVPVEVPHGREPLVQGFKTGSLKVVMIGDVVPFASGFLGLAKYVTTTPIFEGFGVFYVNPAWWANLPSEVREQIVKTTHRFEHIAIARGLAATTAAEYDLVSKGFILHRSSTEENALFVKATVPAFDTAFSARLGGESAELLQQAKALGATPKK